MAELLLDTCAVIWAGNGSAIAEAAKEAINTCHAEGEQVYASPFTAWELGALVARNRIRLPQAPEVWFRAVLDKGRVALAGLPPEVLTASWQLPATPPTDPVDRIMIATARSYDLTVVTRDRKILDYANEGHVKALPC